MPGFKARKALRVHKPSHSSDKSSFVPKSEKSADENIPKLVYRLNGNSNLKEWEEAIIPSLLKLYGHLAELCKTGTYFVPPVIAQPDATTLTKAVDPYGIRMQEYKNDCKRRSEHIEEMRNDRIKMWGEIETHLSKGSMDEIKSHVEYENLKTTWDVLGFWNLIKEVHQSQPGTTSKTDAVVDAQENYWAIHQYYNESTTDYRDRVESAVRRIEVADPGKKPSDSEVAQKFIKKLDPKRYSELMLMCEVDARNGRKKAYPQTFVKAYQLAFNHRTLSNKGKLERADLNFTANGGNVAAVASGDQELTNKQKRNKKRKDKQKQKKLADKGGEKGSQQQETAAAGQHSNPGRKHSKQDNNKSDLKQKWCKICGMSGDHWCQDCPEINNYQQFVQSQGRYSGNSNGRPQNRQQQSQGLPPIQPAAAMPAWQQYQPPPPYYQQPSRYGQPFNNNHYQFGIMATNGPPNYNNRNNYPTNLYSNRGIVGVASSWVSSTIMEQHYAAVAALSANTVMLDNGATCGVFKNALLLSNLRSADRPCTISGIGGQIVSDTIGDFMGMTTVYHHPDALANILSQSTLSDEGHNIEYNHTKQTFYLTPRNKKKMTVAFVRVGGLYCSEATPVKSQATTYTSVASNKLRFTKREVERAEEARRVQRRLGWPDDVKIPQMSTIQNIPVSRRDIIRAKKIWGTSRAILRGKMRRRKPPSISMDDVDWKPNELAQKMSVDVFFIDGDGYLISVLSPLDYVLTTHLPNRDTKSIRAVLNHQLALIAEQEYRISTILCDGEGGVLALYDELREKGYLINPSGAGEHVPIVERKIDTLKGRIRSCLMGLDYQLMFSLLRYLVEYATTMVNLEPCSKREDPTSPWELFHGRKIDYNRHLSIGFGDYAEVKDPRARSNSMQPRSKPCIALLPVLNYQGSWLFLNLRTRRTRVAHQWTELPLADDVIERLNELAASQSKVLRDEMHFRRSYPVDENDNHIEHIDDVDLFDHGDDNVINDIDVDEEQMLEPAEEEEVRDTSDDDSTGTGDTRLRREEQLDMQNPDGAAEFNPFNLMEEATVPAGPVHRYATRSRGEAVTYGPYKEGRNQEYYGLLAEERVYGNMTIEEAINCYGDEARLAVLKEMTQLIRLGVFRFRDWRTLSIAELKSRIPSKTFVKLKYLADGTFDKYKARTVAGGHKQDRSLYSEEETSSPTISLVGLYILASIAAMETRHVITADIGGAYLRAKMRKLVLMLLGREESSVLVSMYPELSKYLDAKGRLTAELTKALYGCIESGRLWYDTFRSKLEANGYICNPCDPCIFNKWHEPQKVQSTVGIHVDDCFISCANLDIAEGVVGWLHEEFEDLNVVRGLTHSYTGMMLDFTSPGQVRITMDGLVTELMQKCNISKSAPTPAKKDLFEDDPDSLPLNENQRQLFHSVVMSCAYIAKRIKPETLVAVSKLASRVNCANEKDWEKLQRLLRYINGTRHMAMCLEMGMYPIQVVASIDSAHAVHGDMRGHTAVALSIGKGTIQAISVKQPINTKSSAETELVAASDGATPAINAQNILIGQSLEVRPLIIHQDNKSTLAMLSNGRAMGPTTRHISIRYFWLTDRINNGEVSVVYVPTDEITADALSKPLQGSQFLKHRATLLNIDYDEADEADKSDEE